MIQKVLILKFRGDIPVYYLFKFLIISSGVFPRFICRPQGALTVKELSIYFAIMYFKISMRNNPQTGKIDGYYRLVESYRNERDSVCHRTILSAGFLDELKSEQLNQIQKILTSKVSNLSTPLFEVPYSEDPTVLRYVEEFYNRMVSEKRIDVLVEKDEKKKSTSVDKEMVFVNSIRHKDVREIGAEWLCSQAINQLRIGAFLEDQGWSEEQTKLAITHIISRGGLPGIGVGDDPMDKGKLCGM